MQRRTARFNRVLFVVLGVVLLAVGGLLLARRFDLIDSLPSSDPLYSRPQARWLHDHEWVWFGVAAAGVLVALIALRWLLVQPRIDRLRTVTLDPDPAQAGRTLMSADALTDAIEDDLMALPGVDRARALLVGRRDAPELVLRVSAHPIADLADVRHRIVTETVPAVRTALDADVVPTQVHLLVAGRREATPRRVVR